MHRRQLRRACTTHEPTHAHADYTFVNFVQHTRCSPGKRRRWKEQHSRHHRGSDHAHPPARISYNTLTASTGRWLQDFLDTLGKNGSQWSVVAHTRWDPGNDLQDRVQRRTHPTQPSRLALRPPAAAPDKHVLTLEQATGLLRAFDLRERLILKLCGIVGLRPARPSLSMGRRQRTKDRITRRVYRASSTHLRARKAIDRSAQHERPRDLAAWCLMRLTPRPPHGCSRVNADQRHSGTTTFWFDKIRPTLKTLDMLWVNYQVLRAAQHRDEPTWCRRPNRLRPTRPRPERQPKHVTPSPVLIDKREAVYTLDNARNTLPPF
jgi:hypothetical protein